MNNELTSIDYNIRIGLASFGLFLIAYHIIKRRFCTFPSINMQVITGPHPVSISNAPLTWQLDRSVEVKIDIPTVVDNTGFKNIAKGALCPSI